MSPNTSSRFSLSIGMIVVFCLAATLTACSSAPERSTVTGTVTYRQKIALPPDAVLTVRIEDVSLADAPAEVLGEQVIETKGAQVPIAFNVAYDADKIEANHTYSLRTRIEDGSGKLLFINDTSIPVITQGNPVQDIEVVVVPAGG